MSLSISRINRAVSRRQSGPNGKRSAVVTPTPNDSYHRTSIFPKKLPKKLLFAGAGAALATGVVLLGGLFNIAAGVTSATLTGAAMKSTLIVCMSLLPPVIGGGAFAGMAWGWNS